VLHKKKKLTSRNVSVGYVGLNTEFRILEGEDIKSYVNQVTNEDDEDEDEEKEKANKEREEKEEKEEAEKKKKEDEDEAAAAAAAAEQNMQE